MLVLQSAVLGNGRPVAAQEQGATTTGNELLQCPATCEPTALLECFNLSAAYRHWTPILTFTQGIVIVTMESYSYSVPVVPDRPP